MAEFGLGVQRGGGEFGRGKGRGNCRRRESCGSWEEIRGKGRYCGESGGGVVVVERAGCREIRKWGRRGDGAPAENWGRGKGGQRTGRKLKGWSREVERGEEEGI